ncbi:MAG: amino acid kinase, partial [Anaerolineae bacterium]|nr:amino acid kinase [Anaerolineae bacterium]
GGSAATDVTGGMAGKVELMLALAGKNQGLKILIFSGAQAGNVQAALQGKLLGTSITSV